MADGATMHLAVSLVPEAAPSHPSDAGPDFSLLARFVQKAEAAGLDMVVLADSELVARGDAPNRQVPFEATTLLAALATVTSRIGLVAAASTVAHQPYNLARRFASLDIISHGRAGWNASMVPNPREAANFSRPEGFSGDDFRRRAEEFIGIVQGLWQGWDTDALLFDKSGGRFFDPEKMHLLDHKGEFFSVRGPLNVARSPQDMPVLVMSGLSEADMDIAARFADVILLDEPAGANADDLKRRALAVGRSPDAIKALMNVAPGAETAAGPEIIADRLEEPFRSKSCDGFNIVMPPVEAVFDEFVDLVLPELRRRGLLRSDYPGATLRSDLGLAGRDEL
ncbi:LLM class flavin-dependent oxidoreductase [Mesorhizobium mediterraneum]|uniref:Nitrilotriacetate monooxygenase n=1 Tax=Mesorhizobium mediterraneum TaxID=43617 RepID=A0AB36RBB4_9HYPH|nr:MULTISPECIES: LLM class flavin-dependent oxidoreductase [Mesorhizobium]AZO64881.1 LLM class flavin-dependent oxidoreductase [Mesorhizobium sp. M6A.T.Cr.TU.016.01.1.1]PAQ01771.1 nitrilotriacetate monooxygenase [Mesorhizobium mediterraneum]RWN39691.1 MAG: LLM class flavin-dependent oxidoreductase [Mesorhizobium sp.]RWP54029.1 MAG: LLM class flavin-dependent oxidoreductase [Mesorhizobium sp.]WIW53977.1 LLM class flavin-dependent oxidoreductase [Mesorhizobium mediterraneum]